jgi:hypothetical protein
MTRDSESDFNTIPPKNQGASQTFNSSLPFSIFMPQDMQRTLHYSVFFFSLQDMEQIMFSNFTCHFPVYSLSCTNAETAGNFADF